MFQKGSEPTRTRHGIDNPKSGNYRCEWKTVVQRPYSYWLLETTKTKDKDIKVVEDIVNKPREEDWIISK